MPRNSKKHCASGAGDVKNAPVRLVTIIIAALAALLLSGCADSAAAYYHKHPHALMREVVACENNGGALARTPPCRKALALNARLF